jgi:hypothetical protein
MPLPRALHFRCTALPHHLGGSQSPQSTRRAGGGTRSSGPLESRSAAVPRGRRTKQVQEGNMQRSRNQSPSASQCARASKRTSHASKHVGNKNMHALELVYPAFRSSDIVMHKFYMHTRARAHTHTHKAPSRKVEPRDKPQEGTHPVAVLASASCIAHVESTLCAGAAHDATPPALGPLQHASCSRRHAKPCRRGNPLCPSIQCL